MSREFWSIQFNQNFIMQKFRKEDEPLPISAQLGVPMTRNRMVSVSAFIDWNSQIHRNGRKDERDPVATARIVLSKTSAQIARSLHNIDPDARFTVQLRLYHGWHKGFEPTDNKRAITNVLATVDFAALSPVRNVIFSTNIGYGDCLLGALPQRLPERLGIHLPNTLRLQEKKWGEKMVDTAMAADVVLSAVSHPKDWILVVAEDDDLIPPIFTAESLISVHSSRVLVLQKRGRSENFLKLDEILVKT